MHAREKPADFTPALMPDIDSLRISHNLAKRTIAYCKRYNEVGNGYTFFMQQLGKSFIYLSHLSF